MSKRRLTTALLLLLTALPLHAGGRQEAPAPTPYRLSLPGADWALDVDLSAFNIPVTSDGLTSTGPASQLFFLLSFIPTESYSDDGTQYRLSAFRKSEEKSRKSRTHLLITFAPARAAGSAADFRDLVLKNLPKRALIKDSGSKPTDYKGVPLLRFRTFYKSEMGSGGGPSIPVTHYGPRTLAAYFVKDNTWITIALAAEDLGEPEEKLFYALLDSVKFADTSSPSTSFDYYHKGRVFHLVRDYGKAAEPLARALSLEHQQRRLDTASWRGLLSNLIDSLAGSGDIERAKEAMDYAASRDPTYPVFQMALARYHAMRGDLDNTLVHLLRAHQNKENRGSARPLADPSYDPAFARFRKEERFRQALKAIKKM